jgi:hypothetical protein
LKNESKVQRAVKPGKKIPNDSGKYVFQCFLPFGVSTPAQSFQPFELDIPKSFIFVAVGGVTSKAPNEFIFR